MRTFTIKQEEGKNLRSIIANELVTTKIEAVKELASNSYDADSLSLYVEADINNKRLTVMDDGGGISEKGLIEFKTMGDSSKISNPITKKGRERIGHWGIAMVLLEYLGPKYTIETWSRETNSHIIGTECFSEETGLVYKVNHNIEDKQGTIITIEGVEDLGTNKFSLVKLKKALTWEIPCDKDLASPDEFKKFLNSEQLVRLNSNPADIFSFQKKFDHGDYQIRIDYFDKKPNINGIYIYVNGRSVGSSDTFSIGTRFSTLLNKVFVEVHADKMKEDISFNRGFFKETTVRFRDLKNFVYSCLTNVEKVTRSPSIKKSDRISNKVIGKRAESVLNPIAENPQLSNSQKNDIDSEKPDIDQITRRLKSRENRPSTIGVKVIDSSGSHLPPSQFCNHRKEFVIDISHPLIYENNGVGVLEQNIVLAGVLGIAQSQLLDSHPSANLDSFNLLTRKLLKSNYDGVIDIDSNDDKFIGFKSYLEREVIDSFGFNIGTYNHFVDAGVIEMTDNGVLGESLNRLMSQMVEYTPACSIMHQIGIEKGVTRERIRQLGLIDSKLVHFKSELPFIYDIGITRPLYLIRNDKIQVFKTLHTQGAFRVTKHFDALKKSKAHLFQAANLDDDEIKDSYVGLERLLDYEPKGVTEVMSIIGYAQIKGLDLACKNSNDRVLYSLGKFRNAREKYYLKNE